LRASAYILVCMLLAGASLAADPADMIFISEVSYDPAEGSPPPFIEFYNAGKTNVDLSRWRVRIASKQGVEMAALVKDGEKVVIPNHGFYLIGRERDRGAWSEFSYKPDFYCELSMDFSKGEGGVIVELPSGQKRDAVGWGPVRWPFYEGTQHPAVSRGHSLERKSGPNHSEVNGNSYDTGDSLTNFRERAKPQPQNINSPRESPAANTEGNAWGRIKAMYYNQ
jgi:hypothetical protein